MVINLFLQLEFIVLPAVHRTLYSNLTNCNSRFSDQRITREQALKGMTYDAAYASYSEQMLGSITPGKKADFVVLDRDIMTIPAEEILLAKVAATVVDGNVIYGHL